MRHATPNTIYLKDYEPPQFLTDRIDLYIELDPERTLVTSKQSIRPNPAAFRHSQDLVLNGEHLTLVSLKIDGQPLKSSAYKRSADTLTVLSVPKTPFTLEVVTEIHPKANTALEGLYLSDGMFCTQCEAQGFRRITYFQDRPDVMSVYTTTLVADQTAFPVLLSNGNLVGSGAQLDGRHWVKWEDPFPKPCYLFALVGGNLAFMEDHFVTQSGRKITLQIYVEAQDLDKCQHAMASLKNAMKWDEEEYGREYDLDLYMIVAVSHFNMGAMENKGLNIFNSKYVLARPDTATDFDYEHVEGVIGHEYFHNWTGNRITCRDWFQLSLKEGLTVFRDQEFSADRNSRSVKRIDEVNMLRTRQFAEDAGPLAHPVRPESYIEINNFYTLTVYEKGAEVVRMLRTLLGRERYRKATDLYFERHDGQAVTCEDFVQCMEAASGLNLQQFRRWYAQAGTPEVELSSIYDPIAQTFDLKVRQSCPPSPGQPSKLPLHIPMALGLLGRDGTDLPLQLEGELAPSADLTRILDIKESEHTFRFIHLPERPVISAFRGFSAPVKATVARDYEELAFLLSHDSDPFNRWDAGQQLSTSVILDLVDDLAQKRPLRSVSPDLIRAYRDLVRSRWEDLSYLALLLTLPSEDYVASSMETVDPVAIHMAREHLRVSLAGALSLEFKELYLNHHQDEYNRFDAAAIGRRRLKNVCLAYLTADNAEEGLKLAHQQFESTTTMTDRVAALTLLVNSHAAQKEACLESFYADWKDDMLVIGKWFAIQAMSTQPGTLERVKALLSHPAFDIRMPNLVRSLIGAFSQSNPVQFHQKEGSGYRFLADHVIELNAINPQIASRMLTPLTAWNRYDLDRQNIMKAELQRVMNASDISPDVYEVASKALA